VDSTRYERGNLLLLLGAMLALGLAAAFAAGLTGQAARLARDRASDRALAEAREALIAYATSRPIDDRTGPGYLPCPDIDDDGWAEATCGSLSGHTGQSQRLGRLPWKTLGLERLRDGYGEPLWYAVSTRHKGLLNCAASATCVDMGPDTALGTITVRDASGLVVHDGRLDDASAGNAGGAAAVVIAPGPPLNRIEDEAGTRRWQVRDGSGDPARYLDKAPGDRYAGEDNADFVDRTDARAGNANGFIAGPVVLADGSLAVNDRIAAITPSDLLPRVMQRVAQEVLQCLRRQGLPAPATCGSSEAATPGARFGRVPAAVTRACLLAPDEGPAWWNAWRRHVFYALDVQPVDASGRNVGPPRPAAVLVAGPPMAGQAHGAGADADLAQWLEGPHRDLERLNPASLEARCAGVPSAPCAPGPCDRVVVAPAAAGRNDVVVTGP